MTNLRRAGVTLLPLSGVSHGFTLSLLTVERPSVRATEFLRVAVETFRSTRAAVDFRMSASGPTL